MLYPLCVQAAAAVLESKAGALEVGPEAGANTTMIRLWGDAKGQVAWDFQSPPGRGTVITALCFPDHPKYHYFPERSRTRICFDKPSPCDDPSIDTASGNILGLSHDIEQVSAGACRWTVDGQGSF